MTQEAIQISETPPLPGLKLVQDVNKAFQTIATDFAGPTDPASIDGVGPYCTWADTANGLIKRRNAANTAWVVEGKLFVDASQASNIEYDNGASGLDAGDIQAAIDEIVFGRGRFIGEAFAIWDHLSGAEIPDNSGSAKFIKLTAGDPYNAGLLTSESVSGSAPLVVATAVISLAESPLDGQTVNLWNTERRIPRAGDAGALENDALQDITGSFQVNTTITSLTGAFGPAGTGQTGTLSGVGGSGPFAVTDFLASRVARTSSETRMKNQGVTFYMRIK